MLKIKKIQDSIVILQGEYKYRQGMIFDLSENVKGYLIFAKKEEASLLVIGDTSLITNDFKIVESEKQISEIEINANFFGAIVSPFGKILESSLEIKSKILGKSKIENKSPDILDRKALVNPLPTGMIAIDTMIPIGKGQRELIIGDRSTGKSTIAINTIINQKDTKVKSIYIAIGQKRSSIIKTHQILQKHNAHKNAIIVFASSDLATDQFFAPRTGMAIAEFFAYQGEDVLVVIDDLTKHANIYREIALSIEKSPGREAYPTDIFHEHALLLERAGNFNEKYNNGSITCLPIVETLQGDVASIIPSNVISITDGQIFTLAQMANNGEFPAIDIGLSVSRTGSMVQSEKIERISKGLKAFYLELFDVKKFADMSIDISDELRKKIDTWHGINNLIIQYGNKGYSTEQMEVLIEMFKLKILNKISEKNRFSIAFNNYCKQEAPKKLLEMLKNNQKWEGNELQDAVSVVFGPIAKIASGLKNGIISVDEYKLLEGEL